MYGLLFVPQVAPDAALAALPFCRRTGRLDRHRRVVGVNHARLLHALGHQLDQRLHQLAGTPHPGAHRAAGHVDLLPLEDSFQPVERQVIAELAHRDVGQQARPRQALVDRLRRLLRSRGDVRIVAVVVALRAGVLVTHVLQDLEAGREVFELLADSRPPIRQRSLPQAGQALASSRSCSISIRSRCSGNC